MTPSLMLRAATIISKTRQTVEDGHCDLLFVCSAQAKAYFLSRLEKIGESPGCPYLRQCAYGELLRWFELVDLRLPLMSLMHLQQPVTKVFFAKVVIGCVGAASC